MTRPENQQMVQAFARRPLQVRAKIALATTIALVFHSFTGPVFAAIWWAVYVSIQLCEARLHGGDALAERMASPRNRRIALGLVAASNLVFGAFGVMEMFQGEPLGVAAGALLIYGGLLNAVLAGASSRLVFLASAGPEILCLCALPFAAFRQELGPFAYFQAAAAVVLNVFGAVVAWRTFAGLLAAGERARAEAEAANLAKSAFLATMSHEIRTPLNGVLGMAQVMAAGELSSEQRDRLEVVRRSGEALMTILNDVLDLSKIEAGQLVVEQIVFDLDDLVESLHAAFSPLTGDKGLAFAVETGDAAGLYRGDPTRLRQVLSNLVSNAIKFTASGGVRLTVAREARGLRFDIADSGAGIAPEAAGRIFEKFVQADASTTRRFGGTGLGLAICRDLVELMGGAIGLVSVPGQGSNFTVRLPLDRVGEAPARSSGRPAQRENRRELSIRLLVAEDNPTNQLVLKAVLDQGGVVSDFVENGALAVAAWLGGAYDAILMDVQMPEMDGLEAARFIRAEELASGRPRTPIIALTANAMSHHIASYAACGMDGFVAKPIEVGKLFDAIEAVLAAAAEADAESRVA